MSILNAVMVPHPPLIIPQVGRGEEKAIRSTIDAYEQAARFVADAKPDTIVVLSPHTVLYYDYFHISPGAGAEGDFRSFGAGNVRLSVRYDEDFVLALSRRAVRQGFPAGTEGEKSAQLDHGAMIPLWFLQRAYGGAPLPPWCASVCPASPSPTTISWACSSARPPRSWTGGCAWWPAATCPTA